MRPGMRLARSGGRPGTKAAPTPKGALLGPLLNGKLPMPPGAAAIDHVSHTQFSDQCAGICDHRR